MQDRTPFNVRCGACDHVWTVAYLPMPLDTAVRLMECASCPNCGETKKIYVATTEPASEAIT